MDKVIVKFSFVFLQYLVILSSELFALILSLNRLLSSIADSNTYLKGLCCVASQSPEYWFPNR